MEIDGWLASLADRCADTPMHVHCRSTRAWISLLERRRVLFGRLELLSANRFATAQCVSLCVSACSKAATCYFGAFASSLLSNVWRASLSEA